VCNVLLEQAATYWSYYYACLPMLKPNIAVLGHGAK